MADPPTVVTDTLVEGRQDMTQFASEIDRVTDASQEEVWCRWLTCLPPWDMHTVFRHELRWHDLFCSGEWSWKDLTYAIRSERGEVEGGTGD